MICSCEMMGDKNTSLPAENAKHWIWESRAGFASIRQIRPHETAISSKLEPQFCAVRQKSRDSPLRTRDSPLKVPLTLLSHLLPTLYRNTIWYDDCARYNSPPPDKTPQRFMEWPQLRLTGFLEGGMLACWSNFWNNHLSAVLAHSLALLFSWNGYDGINYHIYNARSQTKEIFVSRIFSF